MRRFFVCLLLLFTPIPFGYEPPIVHFPVDGDVPVCQAFGHLGHVGVDFNVPVGTRVFSVLPGNVIATAEDSRVYGRFVEILHEDGYATLYAHLSLILVKRGDKVNGGKVIGLSGGDPRDNIDGDGWSSGAHLHFEVRHKDHLENNLYNVDPLEWLDRWMNSCFYTVSGHRCA